MSRIRRNSELGCAIFLAVALIAIPAAALLGAAIGTLFNDVVPIDRLAFRLYRDEWITMNDAES